LQVNPRLTARGRKYREEKRETDVFLLSRSNQAAKQGALAEAVVTDILDATLKFFAIAQFPG